MPGFNGVRSFSGRIAPKIERIPSIITAFALRSDDSQ